MSKPIIFDWTPYIHGFTKSGVVLLHHRATDFEPITIDRSGLVDISRHEPLVVNGRNPGLSALTPEASVTLQATLPREYQKLLKPDETYTLLWPGSEVALWAYGTIREHINHELKNKEYPLVIPGRPHITFSTHTEFPPWPMRAEREIQVGFDRANQAEQKWRLEQLRVKDSFPRTKHTKRNPGAPNLKVSLECRSTYRKDTFDIVVKVTYKAQATARPITFRINIFENDDNYQIGRLRNGTWKNFDNEDRGCGFRIVDDPDVPVTVSHHDRFVSLKPGESWETVQRIRPDWTDLPDDAEVGETFRFVFESHSLDWWDWVSKADHEEMVVKLP